MARKPMVTRTIKATNVTLLCLDIENAEPCNIDVTLPRTYKDEKEMLKVAKSMVETETLKPVSVVRNEVVVARYGMSETDFIKSAHILKPNETNENEIEE